MPASLDTCFLVFSQSPSTARDVAAWDAHAARFFAARLQAGEGEAVRLSRGDHVDERHVTSRHVEAGDLALADEAEVRAGGGGLGPLAYRCPTVWLVERRTDDDAVALRIAAILASVLLGPILDARVPQLLGVKTARERLGV